VQAVEVLVFFEPLLVKAGYVNCPFLSQREFSTSAKKLTQSRNFEIGLFISIV
jgi:hypothetical protein